MNTFKLHIITPEREFYSDHVERVIFHGTEGEIGVLHDHIPLTTSLKSGKAIITKDDQDRFAALHGGFVEINDNRVTILTDAAEWPEEIDLERAEQSKKLAEDRIEEGYGEGVLDERIHVSLARAMVRIEVASEFHNLSK